MRLLKPVVGVTVALWILLGLGYPLVMTGVSRVLFPYQSQGSVVRLNGRIVGARHVGQNFWGAPDYFWGRPSATVSAATGRPDPYNALNSGPSNLAPTNRLLVVHIRQRVQELLRATPGLRIREIPVSLVESSGSGLDPDITVAAALIQIPRVARATGLSPGYLKALVTLATRPPQWGLFGRRRVNVLALNLLVYRSLHAGR
jgi:K+-transporting ATPase ATPase C chain